MIYLLFLMNHNYFYYHAIMHLNKVNKLGKLKEWQFFFNFFYDRKCYEIIVVVIVVVNVNNKL